MLFNHKIIDNMNCYISFKKVLKKQTQILLLISVLLIPKVLHGQNSVQNLLPKVQDAVFTVFAEDEQGNIFSQGSGFFINPTGIGITNFHVLDGAYKAKIKLFNGTIVPIQSVCDYDKDADLVKFKVSPSATAYQSLSLTNIIPARGTQILSLSSPLGLEQTVSTGIVSAVRDDDKHGKVVQITAPISHGSSGSPIINMKGEVLGVSTFNISDGQNLNFAVSSLKLRELTQNKNYSLYSIWNDPLETVTIKKARKLRKQGNLNEAIALLKEAIANDPNNHLAYSELGYTLLSNGEDGMDYLYHACLQDSLNSNYWNGLAIQASRYNDNAFGDLKMMKLSFAAFYRALELNPNQPSYFYNLASLLFKSFYIYHIVDKDALDIALNAINAALELNPTSDNYTLRARIYVARKEVGKALLDCDNAILLNPENSYPYFIRGDAKAFELLDYYGGLADVEKALALVDYTYATKPRFLKINKSDYLGIKAEILGTLMVKEKNIDFYPKIEATLNKAYSLHPIPLYKERKEFYNQLYKNFIR